MVAVIGDIHGCFNTLKILVEETRKKYPDISLYCVGDLVDRGNFSYEVIEYIIAESIKFTPGNHDYMFYHFVHEPFSGMGTAWLYNGYETTMSSYNDRYEKINEHLEMIKSAPLYYNLDDCFICHAGISVFLKRKFAQNVLEDIEKFDKVILEEMETDEGILWTRNKLLDLGKLQVVGHTRKNEVEFNKENNTAYIDTSVYTHNKLTAIIVEKNRIIDTISAQTVPDDLPTRI
jgi:serine/threonine protein phosphatase 1